jgi:hypothetical protein
MSKSRVFICKGGDCFKEGASRRSLIAALRAAKLEVHGVKCQKICKGPVAGLKMSGEVHWYGRLSKVKVQADFVSLARGGKPSERLKKRHFKKRDGKLRK